MTQIKTRAKKGGELGMNGEYYKGGQFLPSTILPKMTLKKKSKGSGKQEIAPYKWEVAPNENLRSIYKLIETFIRIDGKTKKMIIRVSQQTIDYYDIDVNKLQELVDLYNSGERWIEVE